MQCDSSPSTSRKTFNDATTNNSLETSETEFNSTLEESKVKLEQSTQQCITPTGQLKKPNVRQSTNDKLYSPSDEPDVVENINIISNNDNNSKPNSRDEGNTSIRNSINDICKANVSRGKKAFKNRLFYNSTSASSDTINIHGNKSDTANIKKRLIHPTSSLDMIMISSQIEQDRKPLRSIDDNFGGVVNDKIKSDTAAVLSPLSQKTINECSRKIYSYQNCPSTLSLQLMSENFHTLDKTPSASGCSFSSSIAANALSPVICEPVISNTVDESESLLRPFSPTIRPLINKTAQQNFRTRSSTNNTVNFECDKETSNRHKTKEQDVFTNKGGLHHSSNSRVVNGGSQQVGKNGDTNRPSVNYSPTTSGYADWDSEGRHLSSQHHHQPFDLEDVLLLQHPILPPNSHFFCCFYKFHITAVAKVLSVLYAFFYGFLCILSYKSKHAAAFLIAVLVTVSVGGSTLYATFKWSKSCLIPFFLLQVMLVLYTIICVAILLYAIILGPYSYTFVEFSFFLDGFLNFSTTTWICMILAGLIILTLLFCYSALLFWYEYQFIAEVDRFLKSIRKSSSQVSKEDPQNANGNTMAF